MTKTKLEVISEIVSKLTLEQVDNLTDEEIMDMAMERPGHPESYGFLLEPSYFKEEGHLSKTMYALMMRLQKVENLKEKMKHKKETFQVNK